MKKIIETIKLAGKLKEIDRTGWKLDGVSDPESVADHSFRVAFSALLLCPEDLDREKVLVMSIIHDLGEAAIGDIVIEYGTENVSDKIEKERRELEEIKNIFNEIERADLIKIWEEFSKGETKEARFVYFIDKFEAVLQAEEYKKSGRGGDSLDSFKDHFRNKFKGTEYEEFVDQI